MSEKAELDTLNDHLDFDREFGETAIKLGHLRHQDLERLLGIQKTEVPPIGKILVEIGVLEQASMDDALKRCNAYSNPHVPQSKA